MSSIAYHHKGLEQIDVVMLADDQKVRSAPTNPKYMIYIAAIIAGMFDDVYVTLPNRINQDKIIVELFDAICVFSKTQRYYTNGIGKDVNELASKKEEEKHIAQKINKRNFNNSMNQCRQHLPRRQAAKDGKVSFELSLEIKNVGSSRLTKEEKQMYGISNDNGGHHNSGIDNDVDDDDIIASEFEWESDDDDEKRSEVSKLGSNL